MGVTAEVTPTLVTFRTSSGFECRVTPGEGGKAAFGGWVTPEGLTEDHDDALLLKTVTLGARSVVTLMFASNDAEAQANVAPAIKGMAEAFSRVWEGSREAALHLAQFLDSLNDMPPIFQLVAVGALINRVEGKMGERLAGMKPANDKPI